MSNDKQTFQSDAQLLALKVHAAWEKFENVVLFPFRWLARQVDQTHVFQERAVQLKLVK